MKSNRVSNSSCLGLLLGGATALFNPTQVTAEDVSKAEVHSRALCGYAIANGQGKSDSKKTYIVEVIPESIAKATKRKLKDDPTLEGGAKEIREKLLEYEASRPYAVQVTCTDNDGNQKPGKEDSLKITTDNGRWTYIDYGVDGTLDQQCVICDEDDQPFCDTIGTAYPQEITDYKRLIIDVNKGTLKD